MKTQDCVCANSGAYSDRPQKKHGILPRIAPANNVLVTRSVHVSYMYSSWKFDRKLVEFSSERVRSSILHRQSIESEIRLRIASKIRFDEKYVLWGYLSFSNILAN